MGSTRLPRLPETLGITTLKDAELSAPSPKNTGMSFLSAGITARHWVQSHLPLTSDPITKPPQQVPCPKQRE